VETGNGRIVNEPGMEAHGIRGSAGMRFLLDPIQETAWAAGVLCTGFSVKVGSGTTTIVIRVKDTKGKPKVAFITTHSYAECMEVWFTALHSTAYSLTWLDDRFA